MGRVTHTDWCDAECEQATTRKNLAYKRMQQRNHTRRQWRNTEHPEKKKREYINGKKICIEQELKELECLRNNNESKSFYQKSNKS